MKRKASYFPLMAQISDEFHRKVRAGHLFSTLGKHISRIVGRKHQIICKLWIAERTFQVCGPVLPTR